MINSVIVKAVRNTIFKPAQSTKNVKKDYKVIKILTGHGVGRSLHKEPSDIANFKETNLILQDLRKML